MLADETAAHRDLKRTLVSILVPLFNEEPFIAECLTRVLCAPVPASVDLEIIVVDDASNDGSAEAVVELQNRYPGVIELIRHPQNRGKGAAIRTALDRASGEFSIIQDADLEYSPEDYPRLLKPLLAGDADAVFGSRFVVTSERRVLYFWHAVANRALTTLCNMAADVNLTDMETGYKAVRTSLLKSIPIRSDRFGIEPEMTIKLARRRARIYETSISYYGRTYEEGKKIGIKDVFQAIFVIARFGVFTRDLYKDPATAILDIFTGTSRFNRWMADIIAPFLGESVMEAGAGLGNLTGMLAKNRKRYLVFDVEADRLSTLRGRLQNRRCLEVKIANLESTDDFLPYLENFDTVVCLNVLEHVRDDTTGLANLYRVLRPGGRAIVLVPEGMSIYGTCDEVLGHHRRYSEQELRNKLEETGFRVEEIIPFNRTARGPWFVNGCVFRRRTLGRFPVLMFDRFVWLWRRIDRFWPWKPLSLIAVAVRPS